mgnify:FL=1|jgi:hypothetical protein
MESTGNKVFDETILNLESQIKQYKITIDEIKDFAEDGKGFDGRFIKEGNDEVWKHYNEDLKEIIVKLEKNLPTDNNEGNLTSVIKKDDYQ